MKIPTFDVEKFLESLLLDKDREAYQRMDKEQQAVVRRAFHYGHIKGSQK